MMSEAQDLSNDDDQDGESLLRIALLSKANDMDIRDTAMMNLSALGLRSYAKP